MKVCVDLAKCQGHTLCAIIAPELFELDEQDGHAILIPPGGEIPDHLQADAARAIESCPEQALFVES